MKWLALFTLLFLSTNLFAQKAKKALSKEEFEQKRWNNIYRLITEEIETINKVRRKSQKLLYRLFELKSEKVKLYKEKENKEFLAKKLKYGNKIKRKDIFKRTLKLYNHANNYGLGLLRKYPNSKYKAAIYYTLALNSRDFSYDNKELGYLRKAIQYSTGQSQVNYLARTSLAEYYYNNKKWKSAIYQYNTVLKNQDDEWYTKNLLNYGWCLLKDQKFGKAIDSLEKSYKLSRDEFYVDVREQSMTGLISFYVLGKEIKRGVNFIEKFSHNKHESLLKLAQKASGKGFYKETQEIIASLESRISPKKETELYADMRLFQFDLYKQYHKPKKLLTIAKIFPKVVFTDYQKEEAIRKVSEVVGAKQVILKKDYSKYNQEYDRKTLNEIITYFDILSAVNKPEKAQYEFFQAETYYSVQLFEDALKTYKKSIATYEQNQSKEDLRHKNLDAVFSCIDVMKLTKKEKANELEFAYNKYLSYWPSDKKAQKIYPRLFNLYVVRKDYKNMQISLDRYIKHFKTDKKEQKDLYRVQLDMLIKDENTELLANKITSMQKGYLNFKKTEIKKSETILANILFKQFQKLNEEGKSKDAIAGYQKIHYTNYYPDSIKGEAAFNMGMIYTDIEDNHNAFKWYKKSFKFLTDKEIRAKRDFLEKMALRTSLLHNFLNAAKLDKFILENFCSDKNKNLAIFTNAIRNDLANDYITKALYTYDSYQKCITKVPKELKHEIMVHLFENKHESTFMSFVSDNKLHKVFPKDVSFYYERLFWKYYGNNRSKEVQYFNAFKRLKNKNSKLLTKSMRYYKRLQRDINRFQKDIISIPKKDPNPNLFINKLTARINRLKALNEKANKIFDMGHGQVSVLVYDELTKLSASFAQEVDNYSMPIDDKDFQRQFKTEMYKISSNMLKESHSFKDKSQTLIEKYELLIVKRDESDVANEILNIADIRTPASNMAITFGLGK